MATGAIAGAYAVRPHAAATASLAYRRSVRRLLGPHLATTAGLSRAVRLPGVLDAGLRATSADAGAFDDLVDIGLGRGTVTPRLLGALARRGMPSRPS